MSTKLAEIESTTCNGEENILGVVSCWGGTKKGKCIQFTLDRDHTQLTRREVIELLIILQDWLYD